MELKQHIIPNSCNLVQSPFYSNCVVVQSQGVPKKEEEGGIRQASGLVCFFLSAKKIEAFQQLNALPKWSLSTRTFLPPPFPITDAEGAAFNEHNHTLCLFRMKTTIITNTFP